jgi:hypothetical protein
MTPSSSQPASKLSDIHQLKERKMAYTLDTTVGTLLDDTGAAKVFEKHVPGISTNPMVGMARGMTLKALLAMPQAKQAGVTEEMVNKVLAEVNALKK